jgi:hypothetical protein
MDERRQRRRQRGDDRERTEGVTGTHNFKTRRRGGAADGGLPIVDRPSIYCPTESVTHFFAKLVFAAPASFLSLAAVSHAVAESV